MSDVFSLTCISCDTGQEIGSAEEAIAQGWIDLEPDPEGMSWTWTGLCPECQAEQA